MTQTVNKLFLEAVEYEQFNLAYALFIAVQHKIINMADLVETIDYDKFPHEAIKDALKNDTLGLIANSIKLLLLKRSGGDWAVYLAKNEQEAAKLHFQIFREQPLQVVNNTDKMDSSIWNAERKKYISFREIKKRTTTFPSFLFLMDGKKRRKVA